MLFLAADCHIGRRLRAHDARLADDSYLALHALGEAIIKRAAGAQAALLLAGDTIDANLIDGQGIEEVSKFCQRLQAAGIAIYFVEGNHDKQSGRSDNLIPIMQALGCINMHTQTVELDGLKVHGLAYLPAAAYHEAMAAVPPCDLLVTHVAYQHLLGFEGAYTMRLDQVPPHIKNVFVGDIHVTNVTPLPHGNGHIVSPGSLHATKLDELGPHGCCVIESLDHFEDPEFLPIPTRPIKVFNLAEKDVSTVLAAMQETIDNAEIDLAPIARLLYVDTDQQLADLAELEKQLALKGVIVFTKQIGRENLDGEIQYRAPSRDTFSMSEALKFAVDATAEPEEYQLLERLLETDKPQEVLDEHVERALA